MAEQKQPYLDISPEEREKEPDTKEISLSETNTASDEPSAEDLATLRRVSGRIPWQAYTIGLIEFCERFSYYGTTFLYVNFIQQPLPPGSTTGAINTSASCLKRLGELCQQPGALGADQQTSTGLTTFTQFWAYLAPVFGGWIADEFLGRYKTILWSVLLALVGHVFLVAAATPAVIQNFTASIALLIVGAVILGCGTGGFKANIGPLLGEQLKEQKMEVITLRSGERVIRDPAITTSRLYSYFYWLINVGALAGGIGMPYAERYVGFWLAFSIPTILFLLCPLVLAWCKKRYSFMPPTGSVVAKAFKLVKLASKGRWSLNPFRTYKNFKEPDYWHNVKPSVLGASAPEWMKDVDDAWVERGLAACKVFLWYPPFLLAFGQLAGNLTSQSAVLELHGIPNDVIGNIDPIILLIFIPLLDKIGYPALRRAGIRFSPIRRITAGFLVAALSMTSAAVIQYYIYKLGPCKDSRTNEPGCGAPITVWVQAVPYVLAAFAEIFASITGYEYAFTKAPQNMRGLVQGVYLMQGAFSSAVAQALIPLDEDPLLTWNYIAAAIIAAVGGVGFWFTWRGLDKNEDELNNLPSTSYLGRQPATGTQEQDVEQLRT